MAAYFREVAAVFAIVGYAPPMPGQCEWHGRLDSPAATSPYILLSKTAGKK